MRIGLSPFLSGAVGHDVNLLGSVFQRQDHFFKEILFGAAKVPGLPGWAHGHAIAAAGVQLGHERLPHGGGFPVGEALAEGVHVRRTLQTVEHVHKAHDVVPVSVGHAGHEIEGFLTVDGPHRTGGQAQAAAVAQGAFQRRAVAVELSVDKHARQADEGSKLRVDDEAVEPHMAKPAFHGHDLVAHIPCFAGKAPRIHGEIRRLDCAAHAQGIEAAQNVPADRGHGVGGMVEFVGGDVPGLAAHVLRVEVDGQADNRTRPGIGGENVVSLVIQGRSVDLHETGVVGAGFQAYPAQYSGFQLFGARGWTLVRRGPTGCSRANHDLLLRLLVCRPVRLCAAAAS